MLPVKAQRRRLKLGFNTVKALRRRLKLGFIYSLSTEMPLKTICHTETPLFLGKKSFIHMFVR